MLEFFRQPWNYNMLLVVSTLATVAVSIQARAVVGCLCRFRVNRKQWAEDSLEIVMLFHLLILFLMMSRVLMNHGEEFPVKMEYVQSRYVIVIGLLLGAVLAALFLRGKQSATQMMLTASVLPIALLTLPVFERRMAGAFPWVFCAAQICGLIRAFCICARCRRELRRGLSGFSIKQAIDALHTGLLYYAPGGRILLMNRGMQWMMVQLTGRVQRNGLEFQEALKNKTTLILPEPSLLEDCPVYVMEDQTAWLINRSELLISGRRCVQISAVDVTERWQLTNMLGKQENEMHRQVEKLREAVADVESIQQQEELLRVQSKVHDIMAQRLAMLMQSLRSEESLDEADLTFYAADLLKEVREEMEIAAGAARAVESGVYGYGGGTGGFDIAAWFESLTKVYAKLGVSVSVDGILPTEQKYAEFLRDFIREGVTNAVRHGLATEVLIRCADDADSLEIIVENSGFAPSEAIFEGSGIREIRRKLQQLGGMLEIVHRPTFQLIASVDKNTA